MIIQLKIFGEELTTRDIGAIIREQIQEHINNGSNVIIDLESVNMITHTCADEIFGKLAMNNGLCFKIKNANETTLALIKYVIAQRIK